MCTGVIRTRTIGVVEVQGLIHFCSHSNSIIFYLFFSLGKITLRDIKAIFDRQGANYRYHFKTMDPEFGTVKEEVCIEDAYVRDVSDTNVAHYQYCARYILLSSPSIQIQ